MKKIVLVLGSAIILGCGMAYFVFKNSVKAETIKEPVLVQAFQTGAYKEEENALRIAKKNNGAVLFDGTLYCVYIAFATKEQTITNISAYFSSIGIPFYIKEVYVPETFYKNLITYEDLLNKSSKEYYNPLLIDMIKEYEASA